MKNEFCSNGETLLPWSRLESKPPCHSDGKEFRTSLRDLAHACSVHPLRIKVGTCKYGIRSLWHRWIRSLGRGRTDPQGRGVRPAPRRRGPVPHPEPVG